MRRIDLIGTPLDHARSPDLVNALLRARGETVTVVRTDLGPDGLSAYVATVRTDPAVIGAIVTTPLKQAMVPHLATGTALVSFLGATNCVRYDEDGWIGANFDGHGFVAALSDLGILAIAGCRGLLVGCGGAGSAIAASLAEAGATAIALYDVDREKAVDLALRLSRFAPHCRVEVVDRPAGRFDLVVNASPVGMAEGDRSPVDAGTLSAATVVADIVTNPATEMKRIAGTLGRPLLTGEAMVAGQARLLRRFLLGTPRNETDTVDEGDDL
jgi:shikimate dehydrogenase